MRYAPFERDLTRQNQIRAWEFILSMISFSFCFSSLFFSTISLLKEMVELKLDWIEIYFYVPVIFLSIFYLWISFP